MLKQRVPETDHGIEGEFTVELFDQFSKFMRDKGWIETKCMLEAGIFQGNVLEVGPGPGIKGLEWLKATTGTKLIALEISNDMINIARRNSKAYGLSERVKYIQGNATSRMPFEDESFDGVFSNGSLHEWEYPINVFNELFRVLKPGGKLFVSDLRRDIKLGMKFIIKATTKPKAMLPGFITSLNAAYTVGEMETILGQTQVKNFRVIKDAVGLSVVAQK